MKVRGTALDFENLDINNSEPGNLIDRINTGKGDIYVHGLKGSSKEYIASSIGKILGRQVLYITETDDGKLDDIKLNLSYYTNSAIPSLPVRMMDRKQALFPTHLEDHIERMKFLNSCRDTGFLTCDPNALFEKIVPYEILKDHSFELRVGNDISREDLVDKLVKAGYSKNDIVEKPSDYSIRGAVIDVFPPDTPNPFRIEFLGDEIKSIRSFSVTDQTSIEKTDSVKISPVTEIIFDGDNISPVIEMLRSRALEMEIPAQLKNRILEDIESGIRIPNIEWLVPYVYSNTHTIFDYIQSDCILIIDTEKHPEDVYDQISRNFEKELSNAGAIEKFIPPFDDLYTNADELRSMMKRFRVVHYRDLILGDSSKESINLNTDKVSLHEDTGESPVKVLADQIKTFQKKKYAVKLVSVNQRDSEKLRGIIEDYGVNNIDYSVGHLTTGFISNDIRAAIITENDISVKKKSSTIRKNDSVSSVFIKKFSELKPGDYIVHKEFGVGIFRGMKRMKIGDTENDFIQCEYHGGDKIYVPVEKLKLVQRYIGDNNKPRVDKLGSETWKRTVKKVKKAVESVARDLLELYAKRKVQKGFSFSPRDQMFREFEIGFPFEETDDQARSIEEVLADMESSKPMDRLICGDVGFGKTEVALRAAFKASLDGKQVAFIVPTTLLAHQHFDTSVNRSKGYPVSIDMLSRFRTARDEKEILKRLEEGKIDLIIGTHKLLSNKIKFRNLGLVIIDEEHKFGVKHKEKLRSMKSGVDVLALSATPIPRTLQFSLADIRDISLINSPPEGRQPVEVIVCKDESDTIRYAVMEELRRGGSIFFINNRIESIDEVAEQVSKIVPEAKIGITHGRMQQRRLEKTVNDFINGDVNLLVTTAIVESGLDIPRANTIIVKDANIFGIADLYQLKGRVGRGSVKAYAYFLIPGTNKLTPEARKRLVKISELSDLGSGFKLSLSDLEIRGAGNLFGEAQSGHIANVGLEFYLEMLNKAVNSIKSGDEEPVVDPEIKNIEKVFIPNDFISDSAERLYYYKRLSSVNTMNELNELKEEIADRYGTIPKELHGLFDTVELKLFLREYRVEKADIGKEQAVISFAANSPYFKRFAPSGKFRVYYRQHHGYSNIKSRLKEIIH